jgi:hypothetical protein
MKSFSALFAGRDDVCGRYVLPPNVKPDARGKLKGAAQTLREVVTDASYKKHLAGKERIGIVPIRPSDNTLVWFALDADLYKSPTLHKDLAKKINRLGLPLVLTRSKSNGAHLWCFFRDPVPAGRAIDIAKDYIKKLGLDPKTEIFPKQSTIHVEDDGNWINLPYFGKNAVGLDTDGETEFTLKQFLSFANSRAVTLDDLKIKKRESDVTQDGEDEGAPPCVATMIKEGIEEGGRNSALAQIGVFYIKAYPDVWEDKVMEANDTICHPPLAVEEVRVIIKSLHKKNYQYLCNAQPQCALCDKETCLTRKYGVGSGDNEHSSGVVIIEKIEKIDGDEPTYRVTMEGRQFEVPNADAILTFRLFKQTVFKRLNKVLQHSTQKMWEAYVRDLMDEIAIVEPPADTVMAERILTEFKDWASRSAARSGSDVIIGGQLFYEASKKALFFRGQDFLEMCDRKFRIKRTDVWRAMRDLGTVEEEIQIKGMMHKVWKFPLADERWIMGRETL